MTTVRVEKICAKGHAFYTQSNGGSCPFCSYENSPKNGFLKDFSSPARDALLYEGIDTIEKLASYTQKEILKLHGIGKASLPTMYKHLDRQGLKFKDETKKDKKHVR